MNEDQREAIANANRRRAYCCRRCGSPSVETVDGSKCGGIPGLQYRNCLACGNARAITKKPKREKL